MACPSPVRAAALLPAVPAALSLLLLLATVLAPSLHRAAATPTPMACRGTGEVGSDLMPEACAQR